MKTISISIPHALGQVEARRRIEQGFGRLREQMVGGMAMVVSFQEHWEQDRLHFTGGALRQKMTGRLDVRPDTLEIQIDVPDLLAALADRMKQRVQSEGRKLLEQRPPTA